MNYVAKTIGELTSSCVGRVGWGCGGGGGIPFMRGVTPSSNIGIKRVTVAQKSTENSQVLHMG